MHRIIKKSDSRNAGFTMIEMLLAMTAGAILTMVVGILLADSQKNYNNTFIRVNGDATTDGYAAQRAFDSIIRKSSLRNYFLSGDRQILEVYYFSPSSTGTFPDRYARFYPSGTDLILDHGSLEPNTWTKDTDSAVTLTLARNVDRVRFQTEGTSMQMLLSFSGPGNPMPVVCSSIRHN